MIRVVVIDDEALVRSGFSLILNSVDDISVVGTGTGGEALQVIQAEKPDVLLLDIRMPDVDGLAVLNSIRRISPRPAVAMLTTFDADEYILTAFRLGASGFVLKDTEPRQLAEASQSLVQNHPAFASVLDEEAARVDLLTDRERDVLVLVAEGLSNTDIGQRLFLGAGTVKDHVSAILAKLGVSSRVQAALAAQRSGLLTRQVRSAGSAGS